MSVGAANAFGALDAGRNPPRCQHSQYFSFFPRRVASAAVLMLFVWSSKAGPAAATQPGDETSDQMRRVRGGARSTMPRSRGSVTGLGLVLLGLWGAVIPFVGSYFDYAYTPNTTWTWTSARFFLQVLPGAVTFFAGLVLLVSANRAKVIAAGWLAVVSGAWFVVGPLLSPIWNPNYLGNPVGNAVDTSVERIGMFFGLGAVIILLAAFALGRFSVIGVRDVVPGRGYEPYPTEAGSGGSSSRERVGTETPGAAPATDRGDLGGEDGHRVHGRRRTLHR